MLLWSCVECSSSLALQGGLLFMAERSADAPSECMSGGVAFCSGLPIC